MFQSQLKILNFKSIIYYRKFLRYKEEVKLPVIPTVDISFYFFLIVLLYIFYIILSG